MASAASASSASSSSSTSTASSSANPASAPASSASSSSLSAASSSASSSSASHSASGSGSSSGASSSANRSRPSDDAISAQVCDYFGYLFYFLCVLVRCFCLLLFVVGLLMCCTVWMLCCVLCVAKMEQIKKRIEAKQPLVNIVEETKMLLDEYKHNARFVSKIKVVCCAWSLLNCLFHSRVWFVRTSFQLHIWQELIQMYSHFRRVRGDGNCFYRAYIFGLVEKLNAQQKDNKTADNKTADNKTADNKTADNKTGDSKVTPKKSGTSLDAFIKYITESKDVLVQQGFSEIAIEDSWEMLLDELKVRIIVLDYGVEWEWESISVLVLCCCISWMCVHIWNTWCSLRLEPLSLPLNRFVIRVLRLSYHWCCTNILHTTTTTTHSGWKTKSQPPNRYAPNFWIAWPLTILCCMLDFSPPHTCKQMPRNFRTSFKRLCPSFVCHRYV